MNAIPDLRTRRRCCRPGCPNRAVATLTYVYAESIAVVGPLAADDGPHSWDLCAVHALRITAPRGWDLVRHPDIDTDADADLTALLDAVTGQVSPAGARAVPAVGPERLRRLGVADPVAAAAGDRAATGDRAGDAPAGRPSLRVISSD